MGLVLDKVRYCMRDIGKLLLRYRDISLMLFVFILIYIGQAFVMPVSSGTLQRFHLTEFQYHETLLAVAIPYVIIWSIALVGYLRLKAYCAALGKSKDGQAFEYLTKGMFWFTLWLPLSTLIGVYGEYAYHDHVDFTPNIVRMIVYANIILLVPPFLYVYRGSTELLKVAKTKVPNPTFKSTIGFITFASMYTFVVMHDSARQIAVNANTPATYYLPDWLILLTVVIPRLLLWYLGVLAVQNILLYRNKVKGIIYRKALQNLATGIGAVTILIIVLRCVQSLNNPLSKLSLAALLLIVYGLFILMAVGYILVSKGAKELLAIEES